MQSMSSVLNTPLYQPVTTLDTALCDSLQGLLLTVPPPRARKTTMQSQLSRDLREVGMSVHDFI